MDHSQVSCSMMKSSSFSKFHCFVLVILVLFAWNVIRSSISFSGMSNPVTTTNFKKQPFLRWEDERGVSFPVLLDFIKERLEAPQREHWDPWFVYTVDEHAHLWTSHRILDQYQDEKLDVERMRHRLNPADELFHRALQLLKGEGNYSTDESSSTKATEEWPSLRSAIRRGGFPFVIFVGDACVELLRDNHTLPIFNLCMPTKAKNAFAFATYQTWRVSKSSTYEWLNVTLKERKRIYPWEKKISKAVWRGTPTGYLDEHNENQRWKICRTGKSHTDIMDVGFHVNPPQEQAALDMNALGGLVGAMPERDFMKYRAVVDVDGNFWSQRFGTLLCLNSVVIKVEPQWVDYFHFTLEPWVHYLPVKGDLSNFVELVKFAVADENAELIQSIIFNANQWCATHMVKNQLARDLLDTLDFYAQQLDRGSVDWHVTWIREKHSVFAEKNKMQKRNATPLY